MHRNSSSIQSDIGFYNLIVGIVYLKLVLQANRNMYYLIKMTQK